MPGSSRLTGLYRLGAVPAAALAGGLLLPATAVAASCNPCPIVAVAESPAGPVVLIGCAAVSLGLLGYLRRRRALAATVAAAIAVVLLYGMALTAVLAAADSTCQVCPSGQVGAVQGTSTTPTGSTTSTAGSPLTGADVPWIAATILIAGGSVSTAIALVRRKPRPS